MFQFTVRVNYIGSTEYLVEAHNEEEAKAVAETLFNEGEMGDGEEEWDFERAEITRVRPLLSLVSEDMN